MEVAKEEAQLWLWWNMRLWIAFPAIFPRFIIMLRSIINFPFDMPFLNMKSATLTMCQNFLAMTGKFCSIFVGCFDLWVRMGFVEDSFFFLLGIKGRENLLGEFERREFGNI